MSGVRRKRPPRQPKTARPRGSYQSTVGAVGGGELARAAEEIAGGARANASWSAQIANDIHVDVSGDGMSATVWSEAGPAYPAEERARHPLFGNRKHWYGPPGKPFLGPAADERAGAAMAKYADKIDRMCRERGFR